MSRPFLYVYEWFQRHPRTFYLFLTLCVVSSVVMASRITLQENITNFFSDSDEGKGSVFENIEVKDRIVVMISGANPDSIVEAAELFEEHLDSLAQAELISSYTAYADEDIIARTSAFIYEYLPVFLDDSAYVRLEAKLSSSGVEQAVKNAYSLLTSPTGMFVGGFLLRDPLGIGTPLLQRFEQFNPDVEYAIYQGRLFTKDLSTLLIFVQPANSMGDTGNNDHLVSALEGAQAAVASDGIVVKAIGGPIVAVHNARQIKRDAAVTLGMAVLIIFVVIFLSFRHKWSIPIIIIPPLFGAIFALAAVWLIQDEISAIALGAGAVVLGISLSYSIHFISHLNYTTCPRQIIEELAAPLTLGCLTTIGAFAALTFTPSALLQDMGLFAVFALIGTTIFCLIFLPQFLKGVKTPRHSALLDRINRVVSYKYEGNRWVVLALVLITAASLFFYRDVQFDDDMSNINFMPPHVEQAEAHAREIFGDQSREIYIVTSSGQLDELGDEYARLSELLSGYVDSGKVEKVVTIDDFFIPQAEQIKRIERWNAFWARHREAALARIDAAAVQNGFREGAFSEFRQLISKNYTPCAYTREQLTDVPLVSDWISASESSTTLLSRITISAECKSSVYEGLERLEHTIVVDRAYFSAQMVESASADFDYILLISSLIVFVALLISYGRIELTLLTFLPLGITWVIILAIMALLGIKFNIVNIILATFIFGIGDDFSIFIMDGLLQEYKNGRKVLSAHKTAIFFSAFTAIVGMGVLIFAQHPALRSIAFISVLGLSVVVFVSYTIQPMLFRLFVTAHTERGAFPYTFASILNTIYCFLYFLLGCVAAQIYALLLIPLPIKRSMKKLSFHKLIYGFTRMFMATMVTVRTKRINPYGETYRKPAVIIANHQSFIDILLLLSTSSRLVMLTNSWVWNSPFFGWIVRYADFHHTVDGYEAAAERMRGLIQEGYSIVIFPEGTRSVDCSIQRFHKGAFYLAQLLKLDILPILIYGAGHMSTKGQDFYIKTGRVATKTLKRIPHGDTSFGETYQEQAKNYRRWFIEQYGLLYDEFARTSDPYFRDAVIKNFIYKGPVLEWYMRVKCRLDGYYNLWDRLLPRNATITDVGCGYGQLSFMLAALAPGRRLLGIDYDEEKIEIAQHAFLSRKVDVRFLCEDMRTVELPKSDAFLFNDSLHYVDSATQERILTRAAAALNAGGLIVVRDGDASRSEAHRRITLSERWSTKIMRFNRTTQPLTFVTADWMGQFAESNGLAITRRRCDAKSSETLYILTHISHG